MPGALLAAIFSSTTLIGLAPSALADEAALLRVAEAFVGVVRANDCTLTEAEGATLLPARGLSMDDARDAVALMNRVPLFTVSDDMERLILLPELCQADDAGTRALLVSAQAADAPRLQFLSLSERVDPAEAARLIGMIRGNGCVLSEADAVVQMPSLGFSREVVQDIASLLVEGELALFGQDRLTLLPALCDGAAEDDAPRVTALIQAMPAGAGVAGQEELQ
ncbi:MAG: hypothetical protein ACXIVG_11480 [Pararhodobacter sp.]